MRCPKCGGENLDGATRCFKCSTPLGAAQTSAPRGGGGHTGLWLGLVGAAALVILLFIVLGGGGSGGGGGGGAPGVGPSPGSSPAGAFTPAEKQLIAKAERVVRKRFPDMSSATGKISRIDSNGKELILVGYSREVQTTVQGGQSAKVPLIVLVTIDPATGGVTYAQSL